MKTSCADTREEVLMKKPTADELYEAKYTRIALEALNGEPLRRDLRGSRWVWAAVFILAAIYFLWRVYGR
jgi:hypothetical protein